MSPFPRRFSPNTRNATKPFCAAWEGYCRERAIPCFTVVSDQAFESVVLRIFRAGGLLR